MAITAVLTLQLFLMLQWTKEDGHRTATSAVPNLFVPLNTNPKEVQEMRNKVCNSSKITSFLVIITIKLCICNALIYFAIMTF